MDPTPPEWLREAFVLAHDDVEEEVGRRLTPQQINDGHCRLFARKVLERAGGDASRLTVYSYGYEHTWLEYDGAYYDAERTEYGARELEHLPMFSQPDGLSPDDDEVQTGFP